jgi:hypothetical protein
VRDLISQAGPTASEFRQFPASGKNKPELAPLGPACTHHSMADEALLRCQGPAKPAGIDDPAKHRLNEPTN